MAKQKTSDLRPDQYDKWMEKCVKKYSQGHLESHSDKEYFVSNGEIVGRFDWNGLAKDDFVK